MKKIIIGLVLFSMLLISGCNTHAPKWDREHCAKLGLFLEKSSFDDLISCNNATHIIKFHYKDFEKIDICPNYKIKAVQIIHIQTFEKDCCKCGCDCNNCC